MQLCATVLALPNLLGLNLTLNVLDLKKNLVAKLMLLKLILETKARQWTSSKMTVVLDLNLPWVFRLFFLYLCLV